MRDWGKGTRATGHFPTLDQKVYYLGTNEGKTKASKEYWCLVLSNGKSREDDWALVKIWGKIGVGHPQFQVFTGTYYEIQAELNAENRKRAKRNYEQAPVPPFNEMIRQVRTRAFGASKAIEEGEATPVMVAAPSRAPAPAEMPAGWGEW